MQIINGIGGKRQFRANQQIHTRRIGTAHLIQQAIAVEGDIGRPHMRRAGRHPDKAMTVVGAKGGGLARAHVRVSSNISNIVSRHRCRIASRPMAPKDSAR